jgi:hypothetical protein
MSPGWTIEEVARPERFELPTLWFEAEGGKSQTPYRPLLTGAITLKTAPQLGYVGLQIWTGWNVQTSVQP